MKDQGHPGEVGLVAEPIWRRSLGTEPHATFPPLGAGAAGHWVQTKEGLCRVTAAGYSGGRETAFWQQWCSAARGCLSFPFCTVGLDAWCQ